MPHILPPDEVPLYYEETGQGKNILLIHGGAADTRFWQKQVPDLSQRFHVVAIDLRGHGNSGKTDDGNSVAQCGRDLRYILEALQLDQVVVVGWSLGSSVVRSYIQQFGVDHLAGYVNIDQPPYRAGLTEEGLSELVSGICNHKFRAHSERLKSFFATPPIEEELHWMACEMMKTPTGVYCSILQDSWHSDFRPMLHQITIPTIICVASKGLIPPHMAKFMVENKPQARLEMFDNCGHMLFWEQAEKFNRMVTTFVEDVVG